MSPPPYHLRQNKAADRFAMIDAIRRLVTLSNGGFSDYTYFGFGGPYLEDFRLLYELFPEIGMVSFENDEEVFKRQQFHRPSRTIKTKVENISTFIDRYDPGKQKSVFWLDYTKLEYECFEAFKALLGTVAEYSMIKVTLRSDFRDYWTPGRRSQSIRWKVQKFREKFESLLPGQNVTPPRSARRFALLLQDMLQIATEQMFPPGASDRKFIPINSFYYSDGTWMMTLTGIVCDLSDETEVIEAFRDWEFANLDWDPPTQISVPTLSTKERLHLQEHLPLDAATGSKLRCELGYLIEDDIGKTEAALAQYAAFHRYSPYFMRGMP